MRTNTGEATYVIPFTSEQELQALPPVHDVTHPRVGRFVTKAATVLALSATFGSVLTACTGEDDSEKRLHVSPPSANIERIVDIAEIRDMLDATEPKIGDARAKVPETAAGNPAIADYLHTAIDMTAATTVLRGVYGTHDAQFPAVPTESIQSPKTKDAVIAAAYVHAADETVSDAGESDYSATQAHKDIAANMPAGQEAARDAALRAVDVKIAEDLADGMGSLDAEDEAKARAGLRSLASREVRAAATKLVDYTDAEQIVRDLSLESISVAEARKDMADISDKTARNKVRQAIKIKDDYSRISDVGYGLGDRQRELADELQRHGEAHDTNVLESNKYYNSLDDIQAGALMDAGDALAAEFGKNSGLRLGLAQEPAPLKNPGGMIDTSGIKPQREVANYFKQATGASSSEDSRDNPDTYQQFGEVYVRDGKVVFDFQDGHGVTPQFVDEIKELYQQVQPYAEAAFASGELTTMRFVLSGAYSPAYSMNTREVYMHMGGDPITREELVLGWKHELLHSLSRDEMLETNVTDKQRERFIAACDGLKAEIYDNFESSLLVEPKVIDGLRAVLKPEHRAIADVLDTAVDDGKLPQLLRQTRYERAFSNTIQNDCEEVSDNANSLVGATRVFTRLIERAGVTAEYDDLKYIFETAAYGKFAETWESNVRYASMQATVINESNYVEPNGALQTTYGHAEENSREIYASTVNSALTWPQQFKAALKKLSPAERTATKRMLAACTSIMANHPSLRGIASKLQSRYGLAA